MSARGDRRDNRAARSWEREMEILSIVENARRHAAVEEELRQKHDARREAQARMRMWFCRELPNMNPTPGQRHDSHIQPYVGMLPLAKGLTVYLMAGDVEAAERLAKQTGLSLDECLKAFSDVNRMNLPSYMGGELIEKGGKVKSTKKKLRKMAQFVVDHKMTGGDPELDQAAFKALYNAARQPVGQRPGRPVTSALGLLTGRR